MSRATFNYRGGPVLADHRSSTLRAAFRSRLSECDSAMGSGSEGSIAKACPATQTNDSDRTIDARMRQRTPAQVAEPAPSSGRNEAGRESPQHGS